MIKRIGDEERAEGSFFPASQVPRPGYWEMTEKCQKIPGLRSEGMGIL